MKLDIRTLSASLVAGFVSWYLCAGIYNKNADSMWTPLLMALLFLVLAAITCLVVRLTTGRRTRFMQFKGIGQIMTMLAVGLVALMVLAGFGMFAGNLAGGRLSDRYTPGRVAAWAQGTICVALLLTFFCARVPWLAVALMCVCTTGLFAVSSPQQLLLLRHSEGGELLGAASVQVAFNLGNAIGAYCGGLPLEAGLGYEYPALIGAPFALAGFVLLTVFYRRYEPSGRRPLRHA